MNLDELEKLLEKATPGPWRVSDERECGEDHFASILSHDDPKGRRGFPEVAILNGRAPYRDGEGMVNAELIVALRNAAPEMISDLRNLSARVAEIEAALALYAHCVHGCLGRCRHCEQTCQRTASWKRTRDAGGDWTETHWFCAEHAQENGVSTSPSPRPGNRKEP